MYLKWNVFKVSELRGVIRKNRQQEKETVTSAATHVGSPPKGSTRDSTTQVALGGVLLMLVI